MAKEISFQETDGWSLKSFMRLFLNIRESFVEEQVKEKDLAHKYREFAIKNKVLQKERRSGEI